MPNYSTKKKHSSIFLSKKVSTKYKTSKRHHKKHNKRHSKIKRNQNRQTSRIQKGGFITCINPIKDGPIYENLKPTYENWGLPTETEKQKEKQKQLQCLMEHLPDHIKNKNNPMIHPYDVKIVLFYLLYIGYFDDSDDSDAKEKNLKKDVITILGSKIRPKQTAHTHITHISLFNTIFKTFGKTFEIKSSTLNTTNKGKEEYKGQEKYNFYQWIEKYYAFLYKDLENDIYVNLFNITSGDKIQKKFFFDLLNSFVFDVNNELKTYRFNKTQTAIKIEKVSDEITSKLPPKLKSIVTHYEQNKDQSINLNINNNSSTKLTSSIVNLTEGANKKFYDQIIGQYPLNKPLPKSILEKEGIKTGMNILPILIAIVNYEREQLQKKETIYQNLDLNDAVMLKNILDMNKYETLFSGSEIKKKIEQYIDTINKHKTYTLAVILDQSKENYEKELKKKPKAVIQPVYEDIGIVDPISPLMTAIIDLNDKLKAEFKFDLNTHIDSDVLLKNHKLDTDIKLLKVLLVIVNYIRKHYKEFTDIKTENINMYENFDDYDILIYLTKYTLFNNSTINKNLQKYINKIYNDNYTLEKLLTEAKANASVDTEDIYVDMNTIKNEAEKVNDTNTNNVEKKKIQEIVFTSNLNNQIKELRKIDFDNLKYLTLEQIKKILPGAISSLSVNSLTHEQFNAFTDEQLKALTQYQIEVLSELRLKVLNTKNVIFNIKESQEMLEKKIKRIEEYNIAIQQGTEEGKRLEERELLEKEVPVDLKRAQLPLPPIPTSSSKKQSKTKKTSTVKTTSTKKTKKQLSDDEELKKFTKLVVNNNTSELKKILVSKLERKKFMLAAPNFLERVKYQYLMQNVELEPTIVSKFNFKDAKEQLQYINLANMKDIDLSKLLAEQFPYFTLVQIKNLTPQQFLTLFEKTKTSDPYRIDRILNSINDINFNALAQILFTTPDVYIPDINVYKNKYTNYKDYMDYKETDQNKYLFKKDNVQNVTDKLRIEQAKYFIKLFSKIREISNKIMNKSIKYKKRMITDSKEYYIKIEELNKIIIT